MGLITSETEITTAIPAARLFKAFVTDGDTLIPKIAPQAFKSFGILEGDGGPGTIKQIQMGEAGQFKILKEKVEAIDKDNLVYEYSVIEGEDVLLDLFDKVTYKVKFVPNDDSSSSGGGSIAKTSRTYYTKGDTVIKEEFIKEGNDRALVMFKAVEAYLTEHPDA
ncbi:unnamed protein product [Linum tenue]|uniref:Bet v I/Major latex protein domain-containing protein n=1 Tax=Linum tenue TaxID=586396 RepID=A0AAV0PA03_9ROSI|nr:unnamed protein product [Linum tenue]